MFRGHQGIQQVAQHRRCQACGIGVDDNEQRIIGQYAGHQLQERIQVFFQLPDLARRPPAIGRRIHNDGVIATAPLDFPFHKFGAVIDNPADGGVFQTRGLGVLSCPGHHALGRVHMAHRGTGRRCGQGCAAGIGEQVQHLHRPAGVPDLLHGEVPVHRLLRENSRVLEIHRLHVEGQGAVAHLPPLRQALFGPLAAAGAAAGVAAVIGFPAPVLSGCVPDHLGIRPHQGIAAPALQFLSAGGVDHLIVLPLVCNPHRQTPSLQGRLSQSSSRPWRPDPDVSSSSSSSSLGRSLSEWI